MAWELSSWLVLTRSFQLMGALAAGGLNGFLLAVVSSNKLGLTNSMVVLEFMAGITFIYTLLAMLLPHTGRRSKITSWLVFFIVCDIIFAALSVAAITLLASAGLPSNCGGLTRADSPGDQDRVPNPGYTSIRFSDEASGQKGELDKFCAFERSYYFIAIGFIFTFLITVVLSILRICEKSYTKNSRVNELLSSLERANEMDQKLLMTPVSGSPHDVVAPKLLGVEGTGIGHGALSEGILTRNTSVRSAMSASTAAGNQYRPLSTGASQAISRRPVPPPRPASTSAAGPSTAYGLGLGLVQPMAGSEDECADAALVSDGMNHRQQREQAQRMPMLPEEDQMVDIALISDGMRHNESILPPYEPRRGGLMAGHGGESNEMRLSDYVKGQTRAQTMKDSGGY